ncbi:MAG: outer membrane protein assembly factor BamE [Rhodobacteraceae bacterium]|nr:outer membrane protein assembly factor BamE [Paracoccaceae bacterium]
MMSTAPRLCLFALALFSIAACSKIDRKHGYVPPPEHLEQIVVGVDTKQTVAEIVGRPSAAGILATSGWYYVQSKFRAYGLRQRKEIDREVVAISFDGDEVVENIEHFGLENGQVVAISRRITDSNIKGVSFLRQLFGNIGNFAAEQLVNN